MRTSPLAWLLFAVTTCHAQGCAATPEAAAASIIGTAGTVATATGNIGYRAQDVQADLVMQRVWVRVSRCGDVSAPLILVPVRVNLAGGAQSPQPAPLTSPAALQHPAVPQAVSVAAPAAVHAGDAVKAVFASSKVHMEMDATANGVAAIGGLVEITLARRGDEPAHRMRGVLRAPDRVEVQP